MKRISLKKGLDIPITGAPVQELRTAPPVSKVALLGDDYIDMKPTMEVKVGDRVKTGQLLFCDKKNAGVKYTSPGTGTITDIIRGAKRKFESIVIDLEDDEFISFLEPDKFQDTLPPADTIRDILIESGLWSSFRTRPFGKVPAIDSIPSALFVTAMDTRPLAADPNVVIGEYGKEYSHGLHLLNNLTPETPKYLCVADGRTEAAKAIGDFQVVEFTGPHPAGLPSTHIHFLHPASESSVVWHIDYQDVIAIGHLFRTGTLPIERVIALAGPEVKEPGLIRTRPGASITEICADACRSAPVRILSGSILDGREVNDPHLFLGRYHSQIAVLEEGSGRSLFGWMRPGSDRFSVKQVFLSALNSTKTFAMKTALWGGERAIYPLDSYDRVMPLDIIPLALLKSVAVCDTDKSRALGALELIEEDLALCSFVCPGKNNFGPLLRRVLNEIEMGG